MLSEEAHTAITKRHFGVNWKDSEHYDLVLSTERLTVEECVDEVESVMKRPGFQETPESVRMVEDLSLEWAVRSSLRRDARTADVAITVRGDGGVVHLSGVVEGLIQIAAAAEVAAATEGVTSVDNQLKAAASTGSRYRREG